MIETYLSKHRGIFIIQNEVLVQLLSPHATVTEPQAPRAHAPQLRSHQNEKPMRCN